MSDYEYESDGEIWEELASLPAVERGWSLLKLCQSAYSTQRFTYSLTLANSALDHFKEVGDDLGLAHSEMYRAMCLETIHRGEEAAFAMRSAIALFTKLEDQEQWNCRKMLARWLHRDNHLQEAAELVETMLLFNLYEMNLEAAAIDYLSLGKIYCDQDECLKAINTFEKALEIFKTEKCVPGVGDSEILMSRCYSHLKMATAAERHARRAIAIFDSAGSVDKKAQSHSLLGRALNQQSRFSSALTELDVALELIVSSESNNYHAIYQIQSHQVRSLEGLGNHGAAAELRSKNQVINETIRFVGDK